MVVVFPAPFGPRKPVTRPGSHNEAQIVYGEGAVVALDQPVDDDRRHFMINSPPRGPGRGEPQRTRCCGGPAAARAAALYGRSAERHVDVVA